MEMRSPISGPHKRPAALLPSTAGSLRAIQAAGGEIPRGQAPPGANTWLFFLAIHHMQPKMKGRTIPVPSTDGGRAPNDAVNVPSEEVSPNPQKSVLSTREWLPAFSICLWKLGSILKAP